MWTAPSCSADRGGIWHVSGARTRLSPTAATVYGGAHATYCAWTRPMAVYAPSVDRTFFAFGNLENSPTISFYDDKERRLGHAVTMASNPNMDAHRNPHILIDEHGYIYLFYGSHCTPTYLSKSARPFDIDEWVDMGVVADSSSYPQPWQLASGEIVVLYRGGGTHDATETLARSYDGGATWRNRVDVVVTPPKNGCYGVSIAENGAFPRKVHFVWSVTRGDWWQRYHVYYAWSDDGGRTWRRTNGSPYDLPITEDASEMIFESDTPDHGVWLKDIQLDSACNPYALFIDANTLTYECVWRLARLLDGKWTFHTVAASDHMYDAGGLVILSDDDMRIYAPTTVSQPYEDGGDIEEWRSTDRGETWENTRHVTAGSRFCHNHVKTVFNHQKGDFRVFWSYGDARIPPDTTDVDLFRFGEEMDAPELMDLRYRETLAGRVLRVGASEDEAAAIVIRGLSIENAALDARVRTGIEGPRHYELTLTGDGAGGGFHAAGMPYGLGARLEDGSWSELGDGSATRDPATWHGWSFRRFEGREQFAVDGEVVADVERDAGPSAPGAVVGRCPLHLADVRLRKLTLPEPVVTVGE